MWSTEQHQVRSGRGERPNKRNLIEQFSIHNVHELANSVDIWHTITTFAVEACRDHFRIHAMRGNIYASVCECQYLGGGWQWNTLAQKCANHVPVVLRLCMCQPGFVEARRGGAAVGVFEDDAV